MNGFSYTFAKESLASARVFCYNRYAGLRVEIPVFSHNIIQTLLLKEFRFCEALFLCATPTGFEPVNDGVKVHCLTAWLRGNKGVERCIPYTHTWIQPTENANPLCRTVGVEPTIPLFTSDTTQTNNKRFHPTMLARLPYCVNKQEWNDAERWDLNPHLTLYMYACHCTTFSTFIGEIYFHTR